MSTFDRITAAATRIITRVKGGVSSGKSNGLQTVAWDLFECVPEVGAYGDWVSGAMSGATLYAGKRLPDGTVQAAPDGSRAQELVSSIAGGLDGQSEMLGSFGVNLAVAGEAWVVIVPDPEADSFADDKWHVLSTEEVKPQRGKIKAIIDGEEMEIAEYDPEADPQQDGPVFFRVWKSSPRKRWLATSPVIRSITVLEELRLLNAAVAAIARSRITGRGVLLVPAGTRFPGQANQEGADDSLLDTLIEVASTAIREPESAAATVPIILEVPGDLIAGVKWLQFSSEFDALAIQLRDEAIRRFATGADVPAEVLLGLGDASHWGAWALTAEALRMGAEPRLALVCNALTTAWLQPLLEDEGDPDAADWVVWYDTSGLRSSSNKGASALEAFKEGLISAEAARRELGFTDGDAPAALPARRVPSGPTTTEGNELPVDSTQTTPAEVALAASADGYAAALTAAADGLVYAALVKAGERIMRTPLCPRPSRGAARALAAAVHTQHPAKPDDIDAYRLLDGAWDRVPELAARYSVDSEVLRTSLHNYASALLVFGEPHTYDNVTRMLAQNGILPATLIGMTAGAGTVTRD
jgi:hypothetical protein